VPNDWPSPAISCQSAAANQTLCREAAGLDNQLEIKRADWPADNRTPRVTSVPSPAFIVPGSRPTLCWPLIAPFSFRRARLLQWNSARLLGTASILEHRQPAVNCP